MFKVVCVMFVSLVPDGLGCVAQVLWKGGVVAFAIVYGEVILAFVTCVEFRVVLFIIACSGIIIPLFRSLVFVL